MRSFVFYIIGLCVLSNLIFAQQPVKELQEKLSSFHSITADFKQVILGPQGNKLQSSSGKMMIEYPGKFFWETLTPLKQTIIAKDNKVWIYDPDLQQVQIRLLNTSISETPILLLTNSETYLQKYFNVIRTSDSNELKQKFQLFPKNKQESFLEIVLVFENNKLTQMLLLNQLDQKISIDFINIKINAKIDGRLFELKIPANVDIIDQTKVT